MKLRFSIFKKKTKKQRHTYTVIYVLEMSPSHLGAGSNSLSYDDTFPPGLKIYPLKPDSILALRQYYQG